MDEEGRMRGDLGDFIIDLEDEDCPEVGVHLAAWRGDIVQLEELLTLHREHVNIDSRVRPFLATPLRLAATGRVGLGLAAQWFQGQVGPILGFFKC